jgi:hypothetical protein
VRPRVILSVITDTPLTLIQIISSDDSAASVPPPTPASSGSGLVTHAPSCVVASRRARRVGAQRAALGRLALALVLRARDEVAEGVESRVPLASSMSVPTDAGTPRTAFECWHEHSGLGGAGRLGEGGHSRVRLARSARLGSGCRAGRVSSAELKDIRVYTMLLVRL